MHTSELSEVTFSLQIAFALFSLGYVEELILVPFILNPYLKII